AIGAVFRNTGRGDAGALRYRISGGDRDGAAAEIDHFEEHADAIHAGDAAVSLAHFAVARVAAGGSFARVSAAGGYGDSDGGGRAVDRGARAHAQRKSAGDREQL